MIRDSRNFTFFLRQFEPIKALKCNEEDKNDFDSSNTIPTVQSTTQSLSATNPNTHRFCDIRNTWTECSDCYTYEHSDDYFYNYEMFEEYYEDHTCTYTISTVCDPNFIDADGYNCDFYESTCNGALFKQHSSDGVLHGSPLWIDQGVMTDKGFMTPLNCPQCGCGENGPIRYE